MNSSEELNDLCGCGSGKKHKDCCGVPQGESREHAGEGPGRFRIVHPDWRCSLSASLDASYQQYFIAAVSGASTKEAERPVAALPEGQRYLTRVLDSLENAFADFDTETAMLDLPHMQNRKPQAIKSYLEFRLRQFQMLLEAIDDYVEGNHPTGGHS